MKNCVRGLENAAFLSPRTQFFTIRTDPKPAINMFIFFLWKEPWVTLIPVGPRSHECDELTLNCYTYPGPKQFSAANWLAKSTNYAFARKNR